MEEEAWRKDDNRLLIVSQLREALEKYEGLGYLAEQIEECGFRKASYLVPKVLGAICMIYDLLLS